MDAVRPSKPLPRVITLKPLENPQPEWRPTKHAPVFLYGCKDDTGSLVVRVVAPSDAILGGAIQLDSFDLAGLELRSVTAVVITAEQLPPEAIRSTAKCGLKITAGKLLGMNLKSQTKLRSPSRSKSSARRTKKAS